MLRHQQRQLDNHQAVDSEALLREKVQGHDVIDGAGGLREELARIFLSADEEEEGVHHLRIRQQQQQGEDDAEQEDEEARAALDGGDCEGFTPLMEAVCCGYLEAASFLLLGGTTTHHRHPSGHNMVNCVTTPGRTTALMLAAEMGCEEMVSMLLHHGADASLVNCSGWNALMLAALHGHGAVVRALLRHGGQHVDAQDHMGETAIYKVSSSSSRPPGTAG